jgi:hypothetical protein
MGLPGFPALLYMFLSRTFLCRRPWTLVKKGPLNRGLKHNRSPSLCVFFPKAFLRPAKASVRKAFPMLQCWTKLHHSPIVLQLLFVWFMPLGKRELSCAPLGYVKACPRRDSRKLLSRRSLSEKELPTHFVRGNFHVTGSERNVVQRSSFWLKPFLKKAYFEPATPGLLLSSPQAPDRGLDPSRIRRPVLYPAELRGHIVLS